MKKLANFFFSTRLTGVLFLLFAAAMGIATFIENDYGTQTAKALVYNSFWFEFIMIIFCVNFIGNIFRYRLWRKEKWAVLVFHLSFILIIVGAGISRYISYEGIMPIVEQETSDIVLSQKTYLSVYVDDNNVQLPIEYPFLFSHEIEKSNRFIPLVARFLNFVRGGNDFSINTDFKGKPIAINFVSYKPNAYEEFAPDENGKKHVHFVESSSGSRHDHYIEQGSLSNIHNVLIAYDKPTEGAINIFTENDTLKIKSPFEGTYTVMATQQKGVIKKDTVQPLALRALYSIGNMQFVIPEIVKGGLKEYFNGEKDQHPDDRLEIEIVSGQEKKNVVLYGYQYANTPPKEFSLNGLNFRVSYGAKHIQLPFKLKLNDFQLERYPGSNSPKSYASEVTVIDPSETFDYRIYMNHVLDYKGYRFFQSSYRIENGVEETHLSVNHDAVGTWVTYIGYGFLFLGMLLIPFVKGTRFADLRKRLGKIKAKKAALTVLLLLGVTMSYAQNHRERNQRELDSILHANMVPKEHAEAFGKLVIQDEGGRMKPINTFTSELLRKVSKKDHYKDLDANQVAVSMVTNPRIWWFVPFITIKKDNTKLRELIGVPTDQKYIRAADLFDAQGAYKLKTIVDEASPKIIKTKYEESVINVSNRLNLLYGAIIENTIFKFFPLAGDENNTWFAESQIASANFKGTDSLYVSSIIPLYKQALREAKKTGDYTRADEFLESIHQYQRKFGAAVMPSDRQIELEVMYNKYDIFKGLFWQYMTAGTLLLLFVIMQIFSQSKWINTLVKIGTGIILLLFVYQTIGLGMRWYISGHAPWSNGYESMIYVSWATMLFGLIFGRKSSLTLAATTFVASMILMIAHWNWMDPSIGTLVPVLDSYWLMIHVAIIVASYGPFTLSMILGFLGLILYAVTTKKNKRKLDLAIKEITIINEMSMTIGLVLLTIGNFLGGIWANESWGRYWGWDPKETWALVSIMVYAFVLHMRLIPGLRGRLTYNIISVFSFATILMTYLGVNHLLSGLHSYAAGEAAPIPMEIWGWLGVSTVLSVLAYLKFKKFYKK
ncbi:cytochrome c biogenesis protein CcsA [Flavobacteriaceae bacterium F08102]|nr:cytochrome c biogenesis protein CcsA [Flavobacteriaceae bacterium F08102]